MAGQEKNPKKPDWLKVKAPFGQTYVEVKQHLKEGHLHTVCEEARCPNVNECWNSGTATFMLLGDVCTRGCRFCAVKSAKEGTPLDPQEPQRIAEQAKAMNLRYVVLTSVDRDDLPDQGAGQFAATVRAIKEIDATMLVEALIPDFSGSEAALKIVLDAKPDVLAHNMETVKRLTPLVRDHRASYLQSLVMLSRMKKIAPRIYTKSSILVGMGERAGEIKETMMDLRRVGVDILVFGQYLQPTKKHLPVAEYIHPDGFEMYRRLGMEMGFLYVASGPLVRTSYRAGEFFIQGLLEKERQEETLTDALPLV